MALSARLISEPSAPLICLLKTAVKRRLMLYRFMGAWHLLHAPPPLLSSPSLPLPPCPRVSKFVSKKARAGGRGNETAGQRNCWLWLSGPKVGVKTYQKLSVHVCPFIRPSVTLIALTLHYSIEYSATKVGEKTFGILPPQIHWMYIVQIFILMSLLIYLCLEKGATQGQDREMRGKRPK